MRLTRTLRVAALAAVALAMAGCDDDGDVILAPKVPLAYTRYVSAVPDTGLVDWRFIDQLEYSPWFQLRFREFSPYQATAPGARKLRVFPNSTDQATTQKFLIDETVNLESGKYYTLIHTGYARTGSTPEDKLVVLEDPIPAVTGANIAFRVVNLGANLGTVDVYSSATGGSAPLPTTPAFANLAYGTASAYQTVAKGAFVLRPTAAGVKTVLVDATAPAGTAGDPTQGLTTIGGSTMDGSVITAFVFPRSVAGSQAPQTAPSGTPSYASPSVIYAIDRHPR